MKAFGDDSIVSAVLSDWRTAPIDEKLRAMLGFLETLTLRPETLTAADLAPLRAAGLDDAAVESALYVAFIFATMDWLADAFDYRVNDARQLRWVSRILLRAGYGAGCVPG